MSQKEKIEHPAISHQSQGAGLVEATSVAARERWQDRLRALQDSAVLTRRACSHGLPDDAAVVTEAELRGAVADDCAFSGALA